MLRTAFLTAFLASILVFQPVRVMAQNQTDTTTQEDILQSTEAAVLGQSDTTTRDSTAYMPDYEREEGTQLVAVYLGADSCGPCKLPEMKQAISRMKILLDRQAQKRGWSFAAMGVALDWEVETGYDFLQRNGRWDEVIVGRNWTNLGGSRFIFSDSSATPMIPQVVLLKRKLEQKEQWIEVSEYQVLKRHDGARDIPEWVDAGAPLPEEE